MRAGGANSNFEEVKNPEVWNQGWVGLGGVIHGTYLPVRKERAWQKEGGGVGSGVWGVGSSRVGVRTKKAPPKQCSGGLFDSAEDTGLEPAAPCGVPQFQ